MADMNSTTRPPIDIQSEFQSNAPRLFQLHKEMVTLVQGSDSVSEYFTKLKGLWDTYMTMVTLPHCRCDTAGSYSKLLQDQHLMQFLMGLNDSFKTARGNILMMKPLPNLNQAYKLINQEESQRDCTNIAPLAYESTAMASIHHTKSQSSNKPVYGITPSGKKSKYFCQHCKVFGHSIERCFKIHGYPKTNKVQSSPGDQAFSHGKKVVGNVFSEGTYDYSSASLSSNESFKNDEVPVSLAPSQYSQLIGLLSKDVPSNTAHDSSHSFLSNHMASNVHLAVIGYCFFSPCDKTDWIIDSGASDHISPHLSNFSPYEPISESCFITIPNGQRAKVLHKGSVILHNGIELLNVLHVPDFHYNLLSVQKLVDQLSCSFVFYPTHCLIQDSMKKSSLLVGKQSGGLYFVQQCSPSASHAYSHSSVVSTVGAESRGVPMSFLIERIMAPTLENLNSEW
ncbi:unnamed protein product [Cuscuta campestris]|uniref:Retrovirus-related Pol polyprotein from transposon TNT 1-94-like beta-barrel domain-containing protein n=1 Tax=Cuscuta campestris TaxID=132261 RepID=A0A484MXT3_9ASTE|nr:unnamed protein product [Cuscuta campestris]